MDNQQNSNASAPSDPVAVSPAPNKAPMMYIVIIVLIVLAGGVFIAKQKSSAPKDDVIMVDDQDEAGDVDKVDDKDKKGGEDEKMEKDEDADSMETAEFEVEGGEFYYKPNILKVKKGQKVEIEFNNKDGFHDFVLDEFKVKTKQLKDGESEDIEFVADKAGTYEFYCSVGQHRAKGMKGTLIVE